MLSVRSLFTLTLSLKLQIVKAPLPDGKIKPHREKGVIQEHTTHDTTEFESRLAPSQPVPLVALSTTLKGIK